MKSTIYQEFYKLVHRKVTWTVPLIVVVIMLIAAATFGNDSEFLVMSTYASGQIIPLVLVIVGSVFFSMEFSNNAILTLLYKSPNKIYVYFAKFLVLFAYDALLHVIAVIITIIFSSMSLNGVVNLGKIYLYNQTLFSNMIFATFVDVLMSIMIISLIFMTSCLINNNAMVTLLNIGIVFLGQGFSSKFLNTSHHLVNIVRWNPLNMINITAQYYNYPVYHDLTHLSNMQITFGTLTYTVIFFVTGYMIFRKRRFWNFQSLLFFIP